MDRSAVMGSRPIAAPYMIAAATSSGLPRKCAGTNVVRASASPSSPAAAICWTARMISPVPPSGTARACACGWWMVTSVMSVVLVLVVQVPARGADAVDAGGEAGPVPGRLGLGVLVDGVAD